MSGEMNNKEKGLYEKYVISKASGKPIPDEAFFIVLRIDAGKYVDACREGVLAFGRHLRGRNNTLSNDVIQKVRDFQSREAQEK